MPQSLLARVQSGDGRIPFAILGVAALLMFWWNYGNWADPIVDFGRELYVPWRLTEGDALGRDLAWFNGPLSQHFNALVFEVFGTSLRALVFVNFALGLLAIGLLYLLIRVFASRFASTAGALGFVLLCAFSQHEGIANFNWMCPYSHEITHGVLLASGTTYGLVRWLRSGRLTAVLVAGVLFGCCFLTKPETFLAVALATVTAFVVGLRSRQLGFPALAGFVGCALLPIAAMWAFLASTSDAENATSLIIGAWKHVSNPDLSSLLFYKSSLGLDVPLHRLAILGVVTAIWLGVAILAFACGRIGSKWANHRAVRLVLTLACLTPALLPIATDEYQQYFEQTFTPLGLFVGVYAIARAVAWWRQNGSGHELVLLALALGLLAKLGLYCRLHHYGFALAAPALAIAIALWIEVLPKWLAARGSAPALAQSVTIGFVACFVIVGLRLDAHYGAQKTVRVGYRADEFKAGETGTFLNMTLDPFLSSDEDTTFLCLPEGVMLNYLARRRSPIRVINFMPPEIVMFGEGPILRELEENPPDFVLFHTRLTTEYGLPLFGRDYARGIVRWLRANFVLDESRSIGPDPLDPARVEDALLGWRVWRRKKD